MGRFVYDVSHHVSGHVVHLSGATIPMKNDSTLSNGNSPNFKSRSKSVHFTDASPNVSDSNCNNNNNKIAVINTTTDRPRRLTKEISVELPRTVDISQVFISFRYGTFKIKAPFFLDLPNEEVYSEMGGPQQQQQQPERQQLQHQQQHGLQNQQQRQQQEKLQQRQLNEQSGQSPQQLKPQPERNSTSTKPNVNGYSNDSHQIQQEHHHQNFLKEQKLIEQQTSLLRQQKELEKQKLQLKKRQLEFEELIQQQHQLLQEQQRQRYEKRQQIHTDHLETTLKQNGDPNGLTENSIKRHSENDHSEVHQTTLQEKQRTHLHNNNSLPNNQTTNQTPASHKSSPLPTITTVSLNHQLHLSPTTTPQLQPHETSVLDKQTEEDGLKPTHFSISPGVKHLSSPLFSPVSSLSDDTSISTSSQITKTQELTTSPSHTSPPPITISTSSTPLSIYPSTFVSENIEQQPNNDHNSQVRSHTKEENQQQTNQRSPNLQNDQFNETTQYKKHQKVIHYNVQSHPVKIQQQRQQQPRTQQQLQNRQPQNQLGQHEQQPYHKTEASFDSSIFVPISTNKFNGEKVTKDNNNVARKPEHHKSISELKSYFENRENNLQNLNSDNNRKFATNNVTDKQRDKTLNKTLNEHQNEEGDADDDDDDDDGKEEHYDFFYGSDINNKNLNEIKNSHFQETATDIQTDNASNKTESKNNADAIEKERNDQQKIDSDQTDATKSNNSLDTNILQTTHNTDQSKTLHFTSDRTISNEPENLSKYKNCAALGCRRHNNKISDFNINNFSRPVDRSKMTFNSNITISQNLNNDSNNNKNSVTIRESYTSTIQNGDCNIVTEPVTHNFSLDELVQTNIIWSDNKGSNNDHGGNSTDINKSRLKKLKFKTNLNKKFSKSLPNVEESGYDDENDDETDYNFVSKDAANKTEISLKQLANHNINLKNMPVNRFINVGEGSDGEDSGILIGSPKEMDKQRLEALFDTLEESSI